MSSKRGAEYLKKIGLENGHNAVKTIASPFFEVSGDEEILNIALRNSAVYTKQYRLMTFILKRDDSGYILFNDNGGYNVAGPIAVNDIKEFAKINIDAAAFMLFAEIGDNLYTVVTID